MKLQMQQKEDGNSRNCLYCGNVLEGGRSTRKYCSDTCKLAAFHSRKSELPAIQVGNSTAENGAAVIVKDVAAVLNVNPQMVNGNKKALTVNPLTVNDKKEVLNVTALTLNGKKAVVSNVNPITVNGSKTVAKGVATLKGGEAVLAALEAEAFALSAAFALPDTLQETILHKEPAYPYIMSPLLDDIADAYFEHYAPNTQQQPAGTYRSPIEVGIEQWNDERLRAILERVLSMMEQRKVKGKDMIRIRNALAALTDSIPFCRLPFQYPFAPLAKMLLQRFERMCRDLKRFGLLDFRLSYERKVLVMAARYALAGKVEKLPFEQLDFTGTVQRPKGY